MEEAGDQMEEKEKEDNAQGNPGNGNVKENLDEKVRQWRAPYQQTRVRMRLKWTQ
jgi:hypothetical protein